MLYNIAWISSVLAFTLAVVGLDGVQGIEPKVTLEDLEDAFNFEGGPGVQHEFKYETHAGRKECFYQYVKEYATLHVSFEVLRGADKNIDFFILSPSGKVIAKHQWTQEGATDREIEKGEGGYYAFCIDNTASRFSGKLVYIFLVTFVEDEWEDAADEVEEIEMSLNDLKTSMKTMTRSVTEMKKFQAISRRHHLADFYTISSSNTYVQRWSIAMCIVIVISSTVQVIFVRRLFKFSKVTPTAKPRA